MAAKQKQRGAVKPEAISGVKDPNFVKPENLKSSVGRSYKSGSPRGESAGYTTSSPGWRQDQNLFPPAPAGPPTDMSVAGPWGAGMGAGLPGGAPMASPGPGGDRGPRTTGAIAPPPGLTPEMIANATTTPSALFQPLGNVANAQSPSSLGGMLSPGQATSPSSLGGMFPMPGPFLGRPEIPPPQPLPPEIQPAAPAGPSSLMTPSSVPPPPVIHPPNPTVGQGLPANDPRFGGGPRVSQAAPPKAKGKAKGRGKGSSQYALTKEGGNRRLA